MLRRVLAVVVFIWPAVLYAQTVMPTPLPTFFSASGLACNACLLETYASGTSTPLATYTDVALTTPHANPIVLNSVGRPSAPIFLSATSYKFILKSSVGSTIYSADSISAVPANITGISNSTDVVFQVDTDNNGSNVFSFLNGTSVQKAVINESGDLQIDGNLTVGDATAADKSVNFDGNTQDFHIGVDDSTDELVIGRGTALGTTPAFALTTGGALTLTGVVTFPSQAVFSGGATFAGNLIATDATHDIGASGATRFRDLFLSRNAVIGGLTTLSGAVAIATVAPATPVTRTIYQDTLIVAWASIANAGSPAITDDFNVVSLVDNGVGDVTLTFATAVSSATFACIVTPGNAAGELPTAKVVAKTTSSVRVQTEQYDDAGDAAAVADMDFNVICIGE